MPATPRAHAALRTPRTRGGPARRSLFFQELLHDVHLQVTLGQQSLQPRVLLLQLPQPLYVRLSHRPVFALPRVVGRLAYPVRPTQLLHRLLSRLAFAQDGHDLLFLKTLLHLDPFAGPRSYINRMGHFRGSGHFYTMPRTSRAEEEG